jgi:hypothetical protein
MISQKNFATPARTFKRGFLRIRKIQFALEAVCLSYLFFIYLAKAASLNLYYHAFKGVVIQRKYSRL